MYQKKNGCIRTIANISDQELLCFVDDFQALLWRVEIPRSRIEILNEFVIEGLGEDTSLFMKNISFRDELLLPGEKGRVDAFFDKMKERKSASTVFRVINKSGVLMWLKLIGTRSSCDPNYYHGTLSDVTDTAAVVTRIAEEELVEGAQVVLKEDKPAAVVVPTGTQYEINISESLTAMYEQLHKQEHIDGLLFSDVQTRKNKVSVYYSGKVFEGAVQGEIYPYKGTIAQDIERYNLNYLIVDDTLDSIKPIDWALFVPRGIRSYYAKPYYVRGVLRSVVIVCSKKTARFKDKLIDSYDDILEPFMKVARPWRRQDRARI